MSTQEQVQAARITGDKFTYPIRDTCGDLLEFRRVFSLTRKASYSLVAHEGDEVAEIELDLERLIELRDAINRAIETDAERRDAS